MNFNKKKLLVTASLAFSGVYLLSFIIYYLGNFLLSDNNAFLYIDIFWDKATFILMPASASLITLIISAYDAKRASFFIPLIPLSFTRVFYFIPSSYLDFILGGLDSIDSILFASVFSLADVIFSYAFSLILLFAMRVIIEKKAPPREPIKKQLSRRTVLNFSEPISFAFLIVSLGAFAYFLTREIITTVSFIADHSYDFTVGEIFYTVFSYLFVLILTVLHYFALSFLKNTIIKRRLEE